MYRNVEDTFYSIPHGVQEDKQTHQFLIPSILKSTLLILVSSMYRARHNSLVENNKTCWDRLTKVRKHITAYKSDAAQKWR